MVRAKPLQTSDKPLHSRSHQPRDPATFLVLTANACASTVSADEAARFLKVTDFFFCQLIADGFITRASRKGVHRLGLSLKGSFTPVAVRKAS